MLVDVRGRVRKLLEGIDASAVSDPEQLALSQQLELMVAAGASPWGEITRLGRAFWTGNAAAVAAVVALPTTAVMLGLYNNAPDGGRSIVVDWIGASGVAKTAAAGQAQLIALVGQVRETAPADAAPTIKRLNGNGGAGNDTVARKIIAATTLPATTGIAGDWFPIGPAIGFPGAAATPGHGLWAPVDGRIIVAPGRYLGIHVLADVVGSTFVASVGWHERQLTLG